MEGRMGLVAMLEAVFDEYGDYVFYACVGYLGAIVAFAGW